MSEAEAAIAQSLAKALTPESARALAKFADILVKADELGLLDTLRDLLDADVIGEAARSFTNAGTLSLLFNLDKISGMLEALAKNADSIARLLTLLERLDRSGLLALLESLAEPETLGEAARSYLTTGTFYMLNEATKMLDAAASMRLAQALETAVNEGRNKQAPSFFESLNVLLLDEDARRGLYFFVRLLKEIGASLKPR